MTRVGAVIQARVGSSRLPGKVLEDIGGRTMLARVVTRARRASRLDMVIVATTDEPADDAVVAEARRLDAPFYRGQEFDVLDRYRQAAEHFRLDVVTRITSDCPLIDPGLIDLVVGRFMDAQPDVDFASNSLERSYPRGLDMSVFRRDALERAWLEATEPYERVHVTPYIREHPDRFRLLSIAGGEGAEQRWTVDTAEDLEFVRAVYRELGNQDTASWRDVLALLARMPHLLSINAGVRQKGLREL
jgi:spore coat polysaccharide biosynthesis protein SpsF